MRWFYDASVALEAVDNILVLLESRHIATARSGVAFSGQKDPLDRLVGAQGGPRLLDFGHPLTLLTVAQSPHDFHEYKTTRRSYSKLCRQAADRRGGKTNAHR